MNHERLQRLLNISAAVSVMVASAAVIWLVVALKSEPRRLPAQQTMRSRQPQVPLSPISVANAAILGTLKAPVGVVMYSDFQCPYCARFARETLPKIAKSM